MKQKSFICSSCFFIILKNRFLVAVRLFCNTSQKKSECAKNIIDTLGCRLVYFLFLPHFDIICDLLLNRRRQHRVYQPRSLGPLSTLRMYSGYGWARVYACQPKPHRGWVLDLILSTRSKGGKCCAAIPTLF